MFTQDFYDIVDEELNPIIEQSNFNKYCKKRDEPGKKSFALLLWFIQRYNPDLENSAEYVTDGADDSSCDIIFSNQDNFGDRVYYVVQAKWNNANNISGHRGVSKEIKACLSDFNLILSGGKQKSKINHQFNTQYEKLLAHKSQGGKIKFVFLCLSKLSHDARENIANFTSELVEFEEIDINRLKRDYIEMQYKGARTHNPIEHPYEPKGDINLKVEKNKIEINRPFKSYIFLVRPSLISDLFDKYGFALFYKNIRNPLFDSNYNYGIASTMNHNSEKFWYFNNGITAITEKIKPFHNDNTDIKIKGLQVINGAQTVFTVHDVYSNSDSDEKKKMNAALITLRVVESTDLEFNEDVTRFTNSQNPVSERDFRSNDEIQKNLQNCFADNTNIWYERRRGEFRQSYNGAEKISNELFAQAYLAFYLQRPVDAKQKRALFFKLNREGGFYEDIFNNRTKYEDMLTAWCLNWYVDDKMKKYKRKFNSIEVGKRGSYLKKDIPIIEQEFILHSSLHIVALLKKQLLKLYKKEELNNKIYQEYRDENYKKWERAYDIIVRRIREHVKKVSKDPTFALTKYFKSIEDEDNILKLI